MGTDYSRSLIRVI